MGMNFATFNQDYSHMAVGTSTGFRIYYTEPFQKCHETQDGDIALVEMLFSTSLVALVRSPRCLVITNTKRSSTICELTFPTTILAVRLNRKRLVVVSEDFIYLYDISNMKLVHTIDTSPNPHGICALSPSSDKCYLAYPLPTKTDTASSYPSHIPPSSSHAANSTGKVNIIDAVTLQTMTIIEAHRAPLSHISINKDGTRLATASDKGTIIRVFSLPEGRKLFQFRRGSMPARILSMSFNAASTLLCVSSATDTVHIFRLSTPAEIAEAQTQSRGGIVRRVSGISERSVSPTSEGQLNNMEGGDSLDSSIVARKHNGTFAGMIRRTSQTVGKSFAATVGSYLPSAVTEMLEPARDFAWFKLPRVPGSSGTIRSVVALSSNQPQAMIVTNDGQFLVFTIDMEAGGEAHLTSQHSILERDERPGRSFMED